MPTFHKLDEAVEGMLCCPLCKSSLRAAEDQFACVTCGTAFPKRKGIFDFRISHPEYSIELDLPGPTRESLLTDLA